MAIVTFWNKKKEQNGKTLSAVAVATFMAIERNCKILLLSTSLNDNTIQKCYWKENKKISGLFGPNVSNVAMQNGIEGLSRIIKSNKVSPSIITDYTKVVFKNRLEVLLGFNGDIENYEDIAQNYMEIIALANKHYDMVIVDLDKEIGEKNESNILKMSDIIIATASQRVESINELINAKNNLEEIKGKFIIPLVGRYDKNSKYNVKNITRNLLKEKNIINSMPYNTLYFEATEEATVVDFFLRMRNLKESDYNYFFIDEVKKLCMNIDIATKELHSRIRRR